MNFVLTKEILSGLINLKIQKVKILDGLPHLVVFEAFSKNFGTCLIFWNVKLGDVACCKKGEVQIQSFPNPTQGLLNLRKIFENNWIKSIVQIPGAFVLNLQSKNEVFVQIENKPNMRFTPLTQFLNTDGSNIPETELKFEKAKIISWIAQDEESKKIVKQSLKKHDKLLQNIESDLKKYAGYEDLFSKAYELQEQGNFVEAQVKFEKAKKNKVKFLGVMERMKKVKTEGPTLSQSSIQYSDSKKEEIKKKFPVPYMEKENVTYLWGRNAKENDLVSLKLSNPYDWWVHTRQGTSAHVIIKLKNKNQSPSLEILLEAGIICSKMSDQKNASKVEVMYTQCKNLKKPKGLAPGKVLFSHEKSLWVELIK